MIFLSCVPLGVNTNGGEGVSEEGEEEERRAIVHRGERVDS